VIGNAAYSEAPLRNPTNDAKAMAESLTRLGFRVQLKTDVQLPEMLEALTRFARETRNDDVRVFYFAGHGLQHRGKNYLLPVDAELENPDDIATVGADLQHLVEHLQRSHHGINLVILDACRSYPVPTAFRPGTRGIRSPLASSGLAEIPVARGTIIAYSTSPGSVARDGSSKNSVYTKHLVANVETPGLTVEQLFKRVRAGVLTDTEQAQMPWENSSLVGDFCLRPGPRGECPVPVDGSGTAQLK